MYVTSILARGASHPFGDGPPTVPVLAPIKYRIFPLISNVILPKVFCLYHLVTLKTPSAFFMEISMWHYNVTSRSAQQFCSTMRQTHLPHDDVIKWKHFPRNWPFVRGIHRAGPDEFTTQRPVTRSFGVFFDLRLNTRLSKQPWCWWFETPSWSLWRHISTQQKLLIYVQCNEYFSPVASSVYMTCW